MLPKTFLLRGACRTLATLGVAAVAVAGAAGTASAAAPPGLGRAGADLSHLAPHSTGASRPAAVLGATLLPGATLAEGDSIQAPSGNYSVVVADGDVLHRRTDTNLSDGPYDTLLFRNGRADTGSSLVMQTDGNLVVVDASGAPLFSTGTAGHPGAQLTVQNDGNVVLYGPSGAVLYDFNTDNPSYLYENGTLGPGQEITSSDGGTSLVMQTDGNLVLYSPTGVRFSSNTFAANSTAIMQKDGNFAIYPVSGLAVYSTGTSVLPGTTVVLQVFDREWDITALEEEADRPLFGSEWDSSTLESGMALIPGERRTSPDGRVVLALQSDGNFVAYRDGRVVFNADTQAEYAYMQPDGNLVLYGYDFDTEAEVPVFTTRTSRYPGSRLVVQNDRNVVVYTTGNRAVFSTLR